jgi:predicted ATPase
VPLFIEEVTRLVLQRGAGVGGRDGAAVREIPATLEDSLRARLDRLGPARDVAQVAAVIGREFSYALLQAVLPLRDPELQAALEALAGEELIYARGLPPEATYLFKHALVQDAAYESLLKSRRRELHRAVAQALTEQFAAVVEMQPEVLAQHWTAAGEADRAVAAWQQAGDRARERSAYVEAADHYVKAIQILSKLPDGPERARRELPLDLALGYVLVLTKGYGASEVALAFTRARALAEQVGDTHGLVYLLVGSWVTPMTRGAARAAQALADQALRVAERDGTDDALVWAHLVQAVTRYNRGDLVSAREHAERALAHYREEDHRWNPVDPALLALFSAGVVAWELGLPDLARQRSREALDLGRRLNRPVDMAQATMFAAGIENRLREPHRVSEHSKSLRQLATEHQLPLYVAFADLLGGWALALQGHHEEGISRLREGLAGFVAAGQRTALSYFLGLLAEAQLVAGVVVDGLATVEDALAAVPEEEIHLPELLRLRGSLRAAAGADAATVEASYHEAIALARGLGAKMQELRATSSLARLWQRQGKRAAARDLLAPIYGWFTEGFDTRDLVEAKALLEELG